MFWRKLSRIGSSKPEEEEKEGQSSGETFPAVATQNPTSLRTRLLTPIGLFFLLQHRRFISYVSRVVQSLSQVETI
jgi:hypothetical protein